MPSPDTRSLLKLAFRLSLLARSIWLAGILIAALGICSMRSSGGGYNMRHAARVHTVNVQFIQYGYRYRGQSYSSWLPCFCLPIGVFEDTEPGTAIPVYVLDALPAISVLRTGPDLPGSIVLMVLGAIPWGFARLIRNFVAKVHKQ